MVAVLVDRYPATCSRDSEGFRTYKVKFLVHHDVADGPTVALTCPGLPAYGSLWRFGNDNDAYAWCRWDAEASPVLDKEPNEYTTVELTFSTKALETKKCHDVQPGNPLLEPPKISGASQKYTEEAYNDRFGQPILNSAFEMLRGPQVEFDKNRPTVKIEMNVASIATVALAYAMLDTLNTTVLWGFPPRTVKLSACPWEKAFYGTCFVYYKLTLEFDVRQDGTFDRVLLDEGNKVLNGQFNPTTGDYEVLNINGQPPNPRNPTHFGRFKDRNGENTRVILDGGGLPAFTSLLGLGAYISVRDNNVGNNPTISPDWWAFIGTYPVTIPTSPGGTWQSDKTYPTGSLVNWVDHTWQSVRSSQGEQPGESDVNLTWKDRGPEGNTVDFGVWNAEVSYDTGNIVQGPPQTHGPGVIGLQKYGESNFFLLGIPAILGP